MTNLEKAIDFYSRMFATPPAKVKPGYANFAIADPPLKLVLFEGPEGATINHLGVEVEAARQVRPPSVRLRESGLETTGVDETVCGYAEKSETWVTDPDGARWEWYVKLGDAEQVSERRDLDGTDPKTQSSARAAVVPERWRLMDFLTAECCTACLRPNQLRRMTVSRLQLALNVTNLDKAIDFYSRMSRTPPAKVKPGYANFAIADPPLKLVLFEGNEERRSIISAWRSGRPARFAPPKDGSGTPGWIPPAWTTRRAATRRRPRPG